MTHAFGQDPNKVPKTSLLSKLRTSFLTGLVVIAPVGLTIWLIWTVVGWIDGFVLPFVPEPYQPVNFFQTVMGLDLEVNIRGIGAVFFILFTTFIGWVAKGLIGRSLIKWGENLVNRMPVVRSIYSGVKQLAETVFAQSDRSFEKACMIEYPRKDIWAIGFVSTQAKGEVAQQVGSDGEEILSIFLPTTPNPTSGFLLFLPKSDVIELDMSIEEAAKLVISAGLVYPSDENKED